MSKIDGARSYCWVAVKRIMVFVLVVAILNVTVERFSFVPSGAVV